MLRKLIKQGRSGLTVYLPKAWLDKRQLHEGDTVDIEDKDSALVVTSQSKERRSTSLEITNQNRQQLTFTLSHLYRRGFDTISIHASNDAWIDDVAKVTSSALLGMEVTKREPNSCRLESISEPTQEQYDPLLRRSFLIIKESLLLTESALHAGHYSNALHDMMLQQQRIIFFCKRVLAKGLHVQKSPAVQWELLTFLLYIEHQIYYMYEYGRKHSLKALQKTMALFKDLQQYFDVFYKAFYDLDETMVYELLARRTELHFGKAILLLEKSTGVEAVMIAYIKEILRWVNLASSAVFSHISDNRS